MNSLILRTATLYMQPILYLFSLFILLVGHNQPGGGFCGGLIAAWASVLYSIAFGVEEARRILRVQPQSIIGVGLFLALASACLSLFLGYPFMTGQWGEIVVPGLGHIALGTPLFFAIGVYLVVIGATTLIMFSLAEYNEGPAQQEGDS
jgi:multicomponent Na+:H+ antiporter subunit B